MNGNLSIGFNQLFADTYNMHGFKWCYNYYYLKGDMTLWELNFWINSVKG